MGSTLVSARVPAAKREAAASVLTQIGATTTDLINSAFDFVLSEHALPSARRKTPKRGADFQAFCAKSTLDVDWDAEDADYKQIIAEGRAARYESLG